MREILFRGKRVDNGEWVEGNYVHRTKFYGDPDDKHFILVGGEFDYDFYDAFEVDPETVGQYTGLTDKNGERIFEGDIVECGDYNAEDGYGEIILDVDTARFAIIGHSGNDLLSDFDNYYGHELEVIGNIYDNPELIGGEKK